MNRKKIALISVIAVAVIILAVVAGFVYSKYIKEDELDGTITISADLGQIQMLESPAEKQPDGSYVLDKTKDPVTSNTYPIVLPGFDIPKDPYVYITEKSSIPVYVYIEVLSTLGTSNISFNLTENWISLGQKGPKGGDVYVYGVERNGVKVPVALDNAAIPDDLKIPVLAGNKVIVRDQLDKNAKNLKLEFYAYMAETASGDTPAEVYTNTFSTTH